MGPLGFYARSQSVEFGRQLGISDESEPASAPTWARHGFEFVRASLRPGRRELPPGWTFHKAGANRSTRPRSVMTVIYMDQAMTLVEALNAVQANDRD